MSSQQMVMPALVRPMKKLKLVLRIRLRLRLRLRLRIGCMLS